MAVDPSKDVWHFTWRTENFALHYLYSATPGIFRITRAVMACGNQYIYCSIGTHYCGVAHEYILMGKLPGNRSGAILRPQPQFKKYWRNYYGLRQIILLPLYVSNYFSKIWPVDWRLVLHGFHETNASGMWLRWCRFSDQVSEKTIYAVPVWSTHTIDGGWKCLTSYIEMEENKIKFVSVPNNRYRLWSKIWLTPAKNVLRVFCFI
jgi:hypothetical protein